MNPIRLYAPERYREPGITITTELMFPFWGVAAKASMPFVRTAALKYQLSKQDFTLVQHIEDADYVHMPYHWDRLMAINSARADMIVAEARAAGKPLLIDGSGDIERPIDIPNAIVLRLSQYRYSKKPNEITIPFLAEDLLESFRGGKLSLCEKSVTPSVAFMGWAIPTLKQRVFDVFFGKRGPEQKGIFFRARALRALAQSARVELRVKARGSYSGHVKTMEDEPETLRREFVENLFGSDYALAVKGDANSSVRFYEALSAGRIPLFIDTACVLPLENILNYRDFCVFIDWRETDHIADALADFHAQVSPERFAEMQTKAREAFVKYLRYDAFSAHLAAELRTHL